MDWRHMGEALEAATGVYAELKNLCVWNKDNAGMGSLYRSKHELVFVFKHGRAPHINHVALGAKGRYRTNVWDYAGVNSFAGPRPRDAPDGEARGPHADAIRACSNRHRIVLDPFGGSGSALIAAERTGRKTRLIELNSHYSDTIVRRWQALTGDAAVDAADGRTFQQHEQPALGAGERPIALAGRGAATGGVSIKRCLVHPRPEAARAKDRERDDAFREAFGRRLAKQGIHLCRRTAAPRSPQVQIGGPQQTIPAADGKRDSA